MKTALATGSDAPLSPEDDVQPSISALARLRRGARA